MKWIDYGIDFSKKQKDICYEVHNVLISGMKRTYHPSLSQQEIVQFLHHLDKLIRDVREFDSDTIIKILKNAEKHDTYMKDCILYGWVLHDDTDFSKMDKLMEIKDHEIIKNFCYQELSSCHYIPVHLVGLILHVLEDANWRFVFLNSSVKKMVLFDIDNTDEELEKVNDDFMPSFKMGIYLPHFFEMNHDASSLLLELVKPLVFTEHMFLKLKNNKTYFEQMKLMYQKPEMYFRLVTSDYESMKGIFGTYLE